LRAAAWAGEDHRYKKPSSGTLSKR
jgi:hypothetical protein